MKNFNLIHLGVALSASLLFFSCQKQIEKTAPNESTVAMQPNTAISCKPVFLGVNSASGGWNTLVQKWYADDGKLKNLKAISGAAAGTFFDPYLEMFFILNWGEVTYQGNQVYLTDVENNRLLMRVTLDNSGRPVASYLYNQTPHTPQYWNDTTYYYYNGGRLDYAISLFETNGEGAVFHGYRKFTFSYDSYGDLAKVQRDGGTVTTFQYDYSKPITGMIIDFQISSSLKLLEDLDLIQMPMNFALTRIDVAPIGQSYVYKNHVLTNGLVQSYEFDNPFGSHFTFYNGWDCGSTPALNATSKPGNVISNLKQFEEVFPGQH